MTSEHQSSIETWKRRYYDSLEQAEQKERQWQRLEELLRKTISRLTLAADGLDDTLDEQLKALRDAIRDRADAGLLQSRIEAMSATLVRLDSKRAARETAPGALDVLADLLERTPLPRSSRSRVRALRRQLREAGDGQIPAVVRAFAALLEQALNEAEAPGASPGLIGRLFSRQPPAASAAPRPEPQPEPADPLAGQREMLLYLLQRLAARTDAAERLEALRARVLQAEADQALRRLADELLEAGLLRGEAEAGDDQAAVREVLLRLLQRLSLPAEFEPRVEDLKETLSGTAQALDVEQLLCDLAELVQDLRLQAQDEKKEIESFLQQVTDRLQDIDAFVRGSEEARGESYRSGRALGDNVQEQVRGIEASVRDARDLGQLKAAVQRRLDTILEHVEQHRQEETERQAAAEARLAELDQRLAEMEEEAGSLRERIRSEREQALCDALTGIPNRLAWDERVQQEYARWKRFGTPLSLLVWDVDHFKRVNDVYGHKAGDKVLKVIAGLLADNIRETDFIARYGGEEFVQLMPGASQEAVLEVAEKLRHAVEHCGFHYKKQSVPVTISCGIAEFRSGDDIETVFERADRALYRAKAAGRNRCLVAEAGDG
ncbi:diguanylate cyclase [Thiohalobacter sp. IOR34]|uniref:diguanylate cyclase n=1 Tax=Thiohalobacter sp. IOR34 TaxID=3057176 RepID=UPI0025AFA319|nr:diguanylate cyclase [Thiohalobacter sp. IOR34]WJW75458.1 diguanylate cyclase [Thiohalobacter sp. IOR34]